MVVALAGLMLSERGQPGRLHPSDDGCTASGRSDHPCHRYYNSGRDAHKKKEEKENSITVAETQRAERKILSALFFGGRKTSDHGMSTTERMWYDNCRKRFSEWDFSYNEAENSVYFF